MRGVGGFRVSGILGFRRGSPPLYIVGSPAPLLGYIAFGVIDRGTNVVQVRPTTVCPLSCIFCSVDAGPRSRRRWAEYLVEPRWLASWFEEVARVKGCGVEALVDGVGEPLSYPWIVELVEELKGTGRAGSVAVETHGSTLTRRLVDRLWEAGLDRINFSVETLNPDKARWLYGADWYDLGRALDAVEYAARETGIDVHVTPVWLPGINDEDIPGIIEWALRIGAGKRWPPVTVQKFVAHKHGRRPPGLREVSWGEFWEWIGRLEERLGVRLRYSMEEWGMRRAPRVACGVEKGDVLKVAVVAEGWLRGEKIGVPTRGPRRLVAILGSRGVEVGSVVRVRVVRARDCIIVARPL